MNLNSETHYSEMPTVQMQRSTFDLSHEHQTTFNVGELIVIDCQEIYPGDTFEVTTTKVVRLQTLLNPIYGNLYLDIGHFFVPNRIVQDNWPGVMGENLTGAWAPQISYTTPKIGVNSTDKKFVVGSIEDHFGLPVNCDGLLVNALPIRGYAEIWNNYYRDQNTQQPLNIYKGDATKYVSAWSVDNQDNDLTECFAHPRKACRLHDYFSSCLPAPLKSQNPVNIPMSGMVPVITGDKHDQETPVYEQFGDVLDPNTTYGIYPSTGYDAVFRVDPPGSTVHYAYPVNLWADFGNGSGLNGVTATINDLRTAFQVQKMLERDALAGSRYREEILAHFSVSTDDARMQIPEYLGGNRITLNVSQVVNNSQSANYQLGNVGGMSHTFDQHDDYIKSFVEHGFVITVACVRYDALYSQGQERFWDRSDRFSYYWPSLAYLGNMAVKNKEIYAVGNFVQGQDDEVFGYQEAWADLRRRQNVCTGLMRPNVGNTLASWNLADNYSSLPYLSSGWIACTPDIVDRTLAVKHTVSDQIFADFYFDVKATRVLPMFSVPGLIDHF